MPTKMNCPQCGADIRIEDGETRAECPYCGTAITISTASNGDMSGALGMLGNIPGVSELMDKAVQLKRVKELLNAGNKIEAIKVYREITGLGLIESKDAIDALEAGQPITLPMTNTHVAMTQAAFDSDEAFVDEVKDLLARRQKIEAVKIYRQRYKVGLKESKDAVDAMEVGVMPQQPAFPPSEPVISASPFDRAENKGTGCNWIAIGLGLFALLLGVCVALGLNLGIFTQLFGR